MVQLGIPLLKHNFREANSVAHLLAKDSTKLRNMNKTIIHHAPTPAVKAAMKDDAFGKSYLRLISEESCTKLASMGNINAINSSSAFVTSPSFDPNGMAGNDLCNTT
ncbi:hypothetical protein A4A49_55726 [Nicotiana attenuata]|uniref:Uncharacterized protein n=1 Tax=Nicotiana attenuata TaxID=49451 RepID=A0A314KH81_NICAT|nr:hypothetical protein A4A49_55726 [Nicotiana attenuata]